MRCTDAFVTFTFNVGGHGTCCGCGSKFSIRTPTSNKVLRPYYSEHMAHFVYLPYSTCDPDLRCFDRDTGAQCSTCHGILLRPAYTTTLSLRFIGH